MSLEFGLYLVKSGAVTPTQFVSVIEEQIRRQPPLGALAIRAGLLTVRQVVEILESQERSYQRFGDTAMQKQFLKPDQVRRLLALQRDQRPALDQILVDFGVFRASQIAALRRAFGAVGRADREPVCPPPNFKRFRAATRTSAKR